MAPPTYGGCPALRAERTSGCWVCASKVGAAGHEGHERGPERRRAGRLDRLNHGSSFVDLLASVYRWKQRGGRGEIKLAAVSGPPSAGSAGVGGGGGTARKGRDGRSKGRIKQRKKVPVQDGVEGRRRLLAKQAKRTSGLHINRGVGREGQEQSRALPQQHGGVGDRGPAAGQSQVAHALGDGV